MKKLIMSVMASVCLLCGCIFGFTACSGEHEHVWNAGEVTTQPTCSKEGEKTFSCTVDGCGETKTEKIEKTAHSWDGGKITTPAKCDEFGVKTFTCTAEGCGETRTEPVEKTAHDWDGGKLTVIPDINSKGEILYTCSACNGTKRESVAPRADFGEQFYTSISQANAWTYGYFTGTDTLTYTQIAEPDEEQDGLWKAEGVEIKNGWIYASAKTAVGYRAGGAMQIELSASFTGDEEQTLVSARLIITKVSGEVKGEAVELGGDGKDWTYVSEEAFNVENGDCVYIMFINEGAGAPGGKFSFRITMACEHNWDEGTETKQASCTQSGEITYECKKCGDTKVEETSTLPHDYENGNFVKIDNDTHAKQCKNCTALDESNALSHNFVAGEILKQPTNEEDGEQEVSCPDCGYTGTKALPALNHIKGETLVNSTDGATHWYPCVNPDHTDCDVKFDERSHEYTDELINQGQSATCGRDGYKVMACACGATKREIISKDTVPHNYENQPFVSDGNDTHHQECSVCGTANESVAHTWDSGNITAKPTLTTEGVKTFTCTGCSETKTETLSAHANHFDEFNLSAENNPWGYGKMNITKWDDNDFQYEKKPATETSSDAYTGEGVEIKAGWLSGGGSYISYTVTENMTINLNVTSTQVSGGKRMDVRTVVGNSAKYHGDYVDGKLIVNEEYTLSAGDTVYIVFSPKGEEGFEQTDFTIDITKKA